MESGRPVLEPGLLKLIRSHVEETDAVVALVFARSPAFRSLSRDFRACVRALDRWKDSDSEEVGQRVEELPRTECNFIDMDFADLSGFSKTLFLNIAVRLVIYAG